MKKILKWLGVGFIVLIVITLVFGGKGKNPASTAKNSFEAGWKSGQEQSRPSNYDILSREDAGVVENISVLVKPGETGVEAVGLEVKKSCKKQCNISIYDDKKAYELQEEYDKMTGSLSTEKSELDEWNNKNYIYVADHLVGYIEFETNSFNDYPFKDAFYDEMRAKK